MPKSRGGHRLVQRKTFDDHKEWVEDFLPDYRLSPRIIVRYLRGRFGEGDFHVSHSNGIYCMKLPRLLSAKEKDQIFDLTNTYDRRYKEWTDSEPEPESSQHLVWNDSEDKARESSVPLIKASNGLFEVPSMNGDSNANLVYSVSYINQDARGSSAFIYKVDVSKGMTCMVYEVDAHWSWASTSANNTETPRGMKVAVKRLSRQTTPEQFLQEYDNLRAATKRQHRNIVELLNAFRYEDGAKAVHYNFTFPLAAGNMKQLFQLDSMHVVEGSNTAQFESTRYHSLSQEIYSMASKGLWSEFEGLASALAYLHDECRIIHSDIKPSNILLYEGHGSSSTIVAKITDFGLAVDLQTKRSWRLGTKEARSWLQYDAPEMRDYFGSDQRRFSETGALESIADPTSEELKSGDVWKLGSVFVEMLSFLVKGKTGVLKFREYITTTLDELTSDDISDARFDDGTKVKGEVLEWLSDLSALDLRAHEMETLLRSMLDTSSDRPSSAVISQSLKSLSTCLYFDGIRYLHIIPSHLVPCPSIIDQCKEGVEKWARQTLDWRPLRNGERSCSPGNSRISWDWCNMPLYIDVSEAVAQAFKRTCRPISQTIEPTSYSSAPNAYQAPNGRPPPYFSPQGHGHTPHQSQLSFNSGATPQNVSSTSSSITGAVQSQQSFQEIYWCVDKAWSEPRVTKLCTVLKSHQMIDDKSLCESLIKEYNRIRARKGRLLSWKTCLGVDFIQFHRSHPGQDEVVRIDVGLPPADPLSYDYTLVQPKEVHMKIAAAQLIAGIHDPGKASGIKATLMMIPKRVVIDPKLGTISLGWGMHALQRFSLWKILTWIVTLTILGLTFAVLWLTCVDKKDIQNAFVPSGFLISMVMLGLGIPQFLAVD